MSYLVLARKLRPSKFRDIIGQDSICKTLVNAIKANRVAHAFLFTGPRGTGKTSCARILTKALNCQSLIDSEPCNQCENCKEINLGISTDVLEIDAASNRGIEHIRELREGVKFSPAKCKYKTYIIDEVHMLTTESFNALLKTLEEPPPHVKFILATTDHYKIPPTVISRCQRYDFSNIPTKLMVEYLRKVAKNENVNISDSALYLIAGSSVGGMRDALTILDMLISFSREEIKDEKVIEILGLNDVREIDNLLKFIIEKDLASAIALWEKLFVKGRSITRLTADLMKAVKNLNLLKILPENKAQWRQFLPDQLVLYKELSSQTTSSSLQQLFNIILEVEGQIKRSAQAKICFEMGLIKMCALESLAGVAEIVSVLREAGKKPTGAPSFTKNETEGRLKKSAALESFREQPLSQAHDLTMRPQGSIGPKKNKYYSNNLPNEESDLKVNDPGPSEESAVHRTQDTPPPELQSNNKTPKYAHPIENYKNRLEHWEAFIKYVAEEAEESLVSLLNNSTVMELSEQKLIIGYGNIQVFDEHKRERIKKSAATFFNPSLKIIYQEYGDDTQVVTLRGEKEKEKNSKIKEEKQAASQNQKVKKILELFPNSQIKNIDVLEE